MVATVVVVVETTVAPHLVTHPIPIVHLPTIPNVSATTIPTSVTPNEVAMTAPTPTLVVVVRLVIAHPPAAMAVEVGTMAVAVGMTTVTVVAVVQEAMNRDVMIVMVVVVETLINLAVVVDMAVVEAEDVMIIDRLLDMIIITMGQVVRMNRTRRHVLAADMITGGLEEEAMGLEDMVVVVEDMVEVEEEMIAMTVAMAVVAVEVEEIIKMIDMAVVEVGVTEAAEVVEVVDTTPVAAVAVDTTDRKSVV